MMKIAAVNTYVVKIPRERAGVIGTADSASLPISKLFSIS
jgi:hypothetical protein